MNNYHDHHEERELFSTLSSNLDYEFLHVGTEVKDDNNTKKIREEFNKNSSLENKIKLAKALLYQLRYRSASIIYEEIIKESEELEHLKKLALCYLKTREYEKARNIYKKLNELDDDKLYVNYHLMLVNIYLKNYELVSEIAYKTYELSKNNDEMYIAILYWHLVSLYKLDKDPLILLDFYKSNLFIGHHKGYDLAVREAFKIIDHNYATKELNLYDELNQSCYYYLGYLINKKNNFEWANVLLYENFACEKWWAGFSYLASLEELIELNVDIISLEEKYHKYENKLLSKDGVDARIKKTYDIIFSSFGYLLKTKSYNDILIQDIIELSNVSRSTFYKHFKKKEDVLSSFLATIFSHVFEEKNYEEKTHNFKNPAEPQYFEHLLYHFLEYRDVIDNILDSDARHIFVDMLNEKLLKNLPNILAEESKLTDVPYVLEIQFVANSFITTLIYWSVNCYLQSPQNITNYLLKLLNFHN